MQNTLSSQVYMEHSPGYTISWVTNKASVNLRKLKLYQVTSLITTLSTTGKKQQKNTRRLNNTLLNNKEFTEELRKEIKRFLETNDNENTTTQNLRDSEKAVLRGRFIVIQSYLKKQEKHQIDSLTLHLKRL